jgi:hypothetical protein
MQASENIRKTRQKILNRFTVSSSMTHPKRDGTMIPADIIMLTNTASQDFKQRIIKITLAQWKIPAKTEIRMPAMLI